MLDTAYVLPLSNNFNQQFTCTFPIDNKRVTLIFNFRFNHIAGYWFMSVTDSRTNKLLLDSIPLIESEGASSNLMFQYSYMGIGSCFVVRIGPKDITIDMPNALDIPNNYEVLWSDTI